MQLDRYAGRTVLALGAHPDDVELGIGGTLARLRRLGARVVLAVVSVPGDYAVRRREAERAADILGAELRILIDVPGKRIDNSLQGARHWARVHFETLRHAYREAPYLGDHVDRLRGIYEARYERLVDLNFALLEFLREALAIRTPLLMSSTLAPRGAKSEMVLDLCRRVGARALLVGLGGSRAYLDREAFARAGIGLVFQQFAHPQYRQCGAEPFTPGLSAIDLVLNCGPESQRVLDAAVPEEERLAA